jgi:hypothetical protein
VDAIAFENPNPHAAHPEFLIKSGWGNGEFCCQCVASKTCVKGQKVAISGNLRLSFEGAFFDAQPLD